MAQVKFKSGTPILANASATSTLVTTREEVPKKVENAIDIAYKLHTSARAMATEVI